MRLRRPSPPVPALASTAYAILDEHAGVESLERSLNPSRPAGAHHLKGREPPEVRVARAQPRTPRFGIVEGLPKMYLHGDELGQALPCLVLRIGLSGAPPLDCPCRRSQGGGDLSPAKTQSPLSTFWTACPGVISSFDLAASNITSPFLSAKLWHTF